MRQGSLFLILVVVALFIRANPASADAIYYSGVEAVIELSGLEHAGDGVGVNIDPFSAFSGAYDGGAATGLAESLFSENAVETADQVQATAYAEGWATDGSAFSYAGIDGGFQVYNSSPFEATVFLTVSAYLNVETDVIYPSVGQASAYAGIWLQSTTGETFEFTFVDSGSTGGLETASLVLDPTLYSMTVQPGTGSFFYAHPYAEGSASASVSEPLSATLLGLGLALTVFLRPRNR